MLLTMASYAESSAKAWGSTYSEACLRSSAMGDFRCGGGGGQSPATTSSSGGEGHTTSSGSGGSGVSVSGSGSCGSSGCSFSGSASWRDELLANSMLGE